MITELIVVNCVNQKNVVHKLATVTGKTVNADDGK
jgi:hypothetical protein